MSAYHTIARNKRRAKACKMYHDGVSIDDIAEEFGVADYTVRKYLRDSGIKVGWNRPQWAGGPGMGPIDWAARYDYHVGRHKRFADAMNALLAEWVPDNKAQQSCTPIHARSWGMERTWVTA